MAKKIIVGVDNHIKNIYEEIDGINLNVGDLNKLETTDKSNIVNAINEANKNGGGSGGAVLYAVNKFIMNDDNKEFDRIMNIININEDKIILCNIIFQFNQYFDEKKHTIAVNMTEKSLVSEGSYATLMTTPVGGIVNSGGALANPVPIITISYEINSKIIETLTTEKKELQWNTDNLTSFTIKLISLEKLEI